MKQLLFLLLFPCLAMAQYTGNAGQKITLGEQTTADGLVFRGVANDTNVITPFSDTSAYIILDTVNSKFYHYNRTTTYWALAGGGVSVSSFSAGTTGLTPSTATTGAVTLGGTLAVANGGTGSATQNFVDLTTTQSVGGAKTFTSAVTATRFNPTSSTATGTGMFLPASNTLGFSTNNLERMRLTSNGLLGLGVTPSTWTAGGINIEIGAAGNIIQGQLGQMAFINNATFNSGWKYSNNGGASFELLTNGEYQWFNASSGTAGNAISFTQAMTLASTGNLLVGTTTDAGYKLDVNGTGRFTGVSTGAYLKLNAPSSGGYITFEAGGTAFADIGSELANLGSGSATNLNVSARANKDLIFSIGANKVFIITSTGDSKFNALAGTGSRAVLADANGVITAPVSSITTKENVQTLNYGLNEILQINPVSFDYINKYKWGDERNLGFIVEDMFPIVPEVTGTMNNGDMYLDMTKLIPILTKAIQEQNALIKALEQRILTLENK